VDSGGVAQLAATDAEVGAWFADAAARLLTQAGVAPGEVAFAASHGQTVWHEPGKATLQIGDPSRLVELLGLPTVYDFRRRDVAAGGQGAPLVPMADVMLFGHPERGRVLLNIGGMANVTWVPRRGMLDQVVAFDTGPGVAVLDAVTRLVDPTASFDAGGVRAARGRPVRSVVDACLEHRYFATPPPKSTGREVFGDGYAAEVVARVRQSSAVATPEDAIATALSLTVRSIAMQLARWVPASRPRELVVSGGGARNPTLVAELRSALPEWNVALFDDLFFDGDAKEAVAFAYLGWRTLHGLPGNVPTATGARGFRVLGSVIGR
jgi:anhydro-N-acetylmuramic acid kinase